MQQRALHQCSRPQPLRSVPALRHPEFACGPPLFFAGTKDGSLRRPLAPGSPDVSLHLPIVRFAGRARAFLHPSVSLEALSRSGCSFAGAPSTAFRCRIPVHAASLTRRLSQSRIPVDAINNCTCMHMLSDGRGGCNARVVRNASKRRHRRDPGTVQSHKNAQVPCSRYDSHRA